jgi:ABC-type polar amino acid transport system ATPase subunit
MKNSVSCRKVTKIFAQGELAVHALTGVDLEVASGGFICLSGPSGSGKTTLLNMIGGLDRPTEGEITVAGRRIDQMSMSDLADLRLRHIGFVFQAYNLIPVLSARENVEFVMQLQGVPAHERLDRAMAILHEVGLDGLENRRPGELSGGQQQRVAIARSLCMEPSIMLFDEPTSALDPEMINEVLDVMVELASSGMTMICVTHEMGFARKVADTMVFMDHGEIVEKSEPGKFFKSPESHRCQEFLQKILQH